MNETIQYVLLGYIPQLKQQYGWELMHELITIQVPAGSKKERRVSSSQIMYLVDASKGLAVASQKGEYNPNNPEIDEATLIHQGLIQLDNVSAENGYVQFVRITKIV